MPFVPVAQLDVYKLKHRWKPTVGLASLTVREARPTMGFRR